MSAGDPERVRDVAPDWRPESTGDREGGQFHAVTFGQGPAEEYADFGYARSVDDTDIELFVDPGDTID